MDISRSAVLAGHVWGTTLQQLIAVAVTLVVAVVDRLPVDCEPLGLARRVRTHPSWSTFALTWLCVALGMKAT